MRIDILTLFPEMFDGFLSSSIIKRAIDRKQVFINVINFRDYSKDPHHKVDDTPYGGGSGMAVSYTHLDVYKRQEFYQIRHMREEQYLKVLQEYSNIRKEKKKH